MPTDVRHSIRFLAFGASLRRKSLNDRLATLAASVVEDKGGTVDRAHISDFDCPSYDHDLEIEEGIPGGAQTPFNAKQGLLMSASPSMAGGNRGLWALRIPFEHLGARIYPDMFSLAQAHEAFDDRGRIANETLQSRFARTIECFMDFVEAAKHYPALKKRWVEFLGEHPNAATERIETTEVQAA
jgi:chromate reductase